MGYKLGRAKTLGISQTFLLEAGWLRGERATYGSMTACDGRLGSSLRSAWQKERNFQILILVKIVGRLRGESGLGEGLDGFGFYVDDLRNVLHGAADAERRFLGND